ncbi:MAG: STAS/SEC14 domain-containing protein [Crocinitomicaceae bacterium]|nr:STAS/SEC14 domain-containing protein [Crocinitomicaceae bacterium]
MEIPEDVKVWENTTSIYWLDKDGILCSISKENSPKVSPEESEKQVAELLKRVGEQKLCILIDAKHAQPSSKEERDQSAKTLNKITKAMAVIVHNPLGRMVVNLFIGLQKPPYPMKIFKPGDEQKAKVWLKKHL